MAFFFTLCADDYGMTEGVSTGILEAACAGRISAASAMTSMPDWPRAATAWRVASPAADLGLHLTLTVGAPLGPMPTIASAGVFPPLGTFLAGRGGLGEKASDEIVAEFGRQIAAFVAQFGRPPTHVDGHQHVHALPSVRTALFAALRAHGLQGTLVRDSGDRALRILRRGYAATKAGTVAMLTRGFAAKLRNEGFSVNDGFAGYSRFNPAADIERQFASYLRDPGSRHLVMCHPGYVDEALRQIDPVTTARERELSFLLSPQWLALMRSRGAQLHAVTADGQLSTGRESFIERAR